MENVCAMLCKTRAISEEEEEGVDPTPTEMAVGKNPDRTVSSKTLTIGDLGRIDLSANARRIYPTMAPKIQKVWHQIERIRRDFPRIPFQMARCDISRAYKWIRLRLKAASILMSEFEKRSCRALCVFLRRFSRVTIRYRILAWVVLYFYRYRHSPSSKLFPVRSIAEF